MVIWIYKGGCDEISGLMYFFNIRKDKQEKQGGGL